MYYVSRNGVPLGQFSIEQINGKLAEGSLNGSDLAWQDGMAGWEPLSTVPGVVLAPSPGSAPPPLPGPAGTYAPPLSNLGPQQWMGAPPSNSGLAVASMVLGILCLVLFFTHVFALLLGLLAVVFGHVSRGTIFRSQGRVGGGGMALTGLITGYLGITLAIALIALATFVVTQVMDKDSEFGKAIKEAAERHEKRMEKELERERLNGTEGQPSNPGGN